MHLREKLAFGERWVFFFLEAKKKEGKLAFGGGFFNLPIKQGESPVSSHREEWNRRSKDLHYWAFRL
jgi:hypothetical protein